MKNSPKSGRMTRRAFLKRSGAAMLGVGMLAGGYASFWEPVQLDIVRPSFRCPRLPAAFDGIRIAHFSDLHLGFYSRKSVIARLAEAIGSETPDLVLFTGDAVDSEADALREYLPLLASMNGTLGKFAILGNHDYMTRPDLVADMLKVAGFQVLRNGSALVERRGEAIAIVGLDDGLKGFPDPAKGLGGVPDGLFTLLMMHEPDYADTAAAYPFDMQISGHSHGGQVRVPLIGAMLTPPGARRYVMGAYAVGERAMPLYVNRGIGETHLPIRFLCTPELTMMTLRSGNA